MRPEQKPPSVPGALGPGERALAAGGVLTASVAALLWASGQLAGFVFGHTWMHVDPADALSVL